MQMQFIGIIAIDKGGMDLNSHTTPRMTFSEAASWYIDTVAFVRGMVATTPSINEASVMIYDAATVASVKTEPIDGVLFRNGRELKVLPMSG